MSLRSTARHRRNAARATARHHDGDAGDSLSIACGVASGSASLLPVSALEIEICLRAELAQLQYSRHNLNDNLTAGELAHTRVLAVTMSYPDHNLRLHLQKERQSCPFSSLWERRKVQAALNRTVNWTAIQVTPG